MDRLAVHRGGVSLAMNRKAAAHEVVADPADQSVGAPGAYYFLFGDDRTSPIGIIHGCPCGCGGRSCLFFSGKGGPGRSEWTVSGEWPKVTLSPSIGIKYDANGTRPAGGGWHWHGYLEGGEFVER